MNALDLQMLEQLSRDALCAQNEAEDHLRELRFDKAPFAVRVQQNLLVQQFAQLRRRVDRIIEREYEGRLMAHVLRNGVTVITVLAAHEESFGVPIIVRKSI